MATGKKDITRRKTPFVFSVSFRVVLVIAAISMVIAYLSMYINPQKWGLPLFFGLYFIPIACFNLFLLIIAVMHRSRSAWIPAIALLPSLLYAESFFKVGGNITPEKEGIKLKVESYNVGMFSASEKRGNNKKMSKRECRDSIMAHIRQSQPDIACFQEFYVDSKKQADTILKEYRYRYYHLFRIRNGDFFGNIILSKFPILSSGKISFPQSTNLSIFSDIEHYGKIFRVYNNHLESYNVSFTGLVKKIAGSSSTARDSISNELIHVHESMRGTFIKRSNQVTKIVSTITECDYPSIICGDFNDTPVSYTYHRLSKGRKDSFREAGNGFSGTFIPVWPLLRIDYILFPDEYEGTKHTTHKIRYSDHYPISAEIII